MLLEKNKQKITVGKEVGKPNPCALGRHMTECYWLQKTIWWFLIKLHKELPNDPTTPLLNISQKNGKQGLKQVSRHSHSWQYYSQEPKGESSPSVYQRMNGFLKCGIYIQWHIIQP